MEQSIKDKCIVNYLMFLFFLLYFIYLFLETREGREKERERNINVCLPLVCPPLGTWPATQACALTGNQTGDPLVRRLVLKPLSCTSQGYLMFLKVIFSYPKLLGWDFMKECTEEILPEVIFSSFPFSVTFKIYSQKNNNSQCRFISCIYLQVYIFYRHIIVPVTGVLMVLSKLFCCCPLLKT